MAMVIGKPDKKEVKKLIKYIKKNRNNIYNLHFSGGKIREVMFDIKKNGDIK